jgi:ketosteroid isomerase-like protein
MGVRKGIVSLAISVFLLSGCNKRTAATADSATPAGTASSTPSSSPSTSFDENAARAQIIAADSAFVRAITSKNVDSLMIYYEPNVVSLGKTAVKGSADLRKSYEATVKNPPHAIDFQTGGVYFSNDHSMAWDYGTVTVTSDVKGKTVKSSGTYLNVWKSVDGKWKIVAEIST